MSPWPRGPAAALMVTADVRPPRCCSTLGASDVPGERGRYSGRTRASLDGRLWGHNPVNRHSATPPGCPVPIHHPPYGFVSGKPRPSKSPLAGLVDWFGFTNAELLRAMPAGVTGAAAALYAAGHLRLPPWMGAGMQLAVLIGSAALGFALGMLAVRLVVHGSATFVARSVLPSGQTTPSRDDHSREDALLMQRDVRGALESFEAKIASDPMLVGTRLRAADLYAREGKDPRRAEALFAQAEELVGVRRVFPADHEGRIEWLRERLTEMRPHGADAQCFCPSPR